MYYGIDIGPSVTVVSFMQEGSRDPETVTTVLGAEKYQIPTALSKKNGTNRWFFGREALQRARQGEAEEAKDLFDSAVSNKTMLLEGKQYPARELLAVFLRHVLELTGVPFRTDRTERICLTAPEVSMDFAETAAVLAAKLGLPGERLSVLDHRESFFYYALSQDPKLFLHDVLLIDCNGQRIRSDLLTRQSGRIPQTVQITGSEDTFTGTDRDLEFTGIVQKLTSGKIISAVYLVGNGFDGGWMKQSLEELLHGRRVFAGKNLYAKGACLAGLVLDGKKEWPFLYIGTNELKLGLSLRVSDRNKEKFITLSEPGRNWFTGDNSCEVILDGTPEVELWIRFPGVRRSAVERLSLSGLPERPARTTRLRIASHPLSDHAIEVQITDLGFGEIEPGSEKVWKHTVTAEDET